MIKKVNGNETIKKKVFRNNNKQLMKALNLIRTSREQVYRTHFLHRFKISTLKQIIRPAPARVANISSLA